MHRRTLLALGVTALACSPALAQTATAPPAAAAPDHPWAVKPEVGGWVIMVKAYQGPSAKALAERFAQELRTTYKVPAFLFEKGTEDRKKEEERAAKERDKQRKAEEAQFLQLTERLRAEALAKGFEFQETPLKLRVPKVQYEEQWAVLVGGWPSMEAARKQLDVIRQWPAPTDTGLLDSSTILRKSGASERAYLNPFHTAFVSRNPVAPRTLDEESQTDPRMIQLNSAEELSVLRIKKPWTIVVKMYAMPIKDIADKDGASKSPLMRVFKPEADPMDAICRQARAMAVALREIKPTAKAPQARPVESYVLYTFNGAMVCAGQFDSPDDPALKAEQAYLEGMTFEVSKVRGGPGEKQRMFDQLVAMRVR